MINTQMNTYFNDLISIQIFLFFNSLVTYYKVVLNFGSEHLNNLECDLVRRKSPILKFMGTPSAFSVMFSKRDKFRDFLLGYLEDKVFPKCGLL